MLNISKENVWEFRGWRRQAKKKQDFLEGCSFRVPAFLHLYKDGEKKGILQYQMALHLPLVICIFSLESCGYTLLVRLKLTYFSASWSKDQKQFEEERRGSETYLPQLFTMGLATLIIGDSSGDRTSTLAFTDLSLKQEKVARRKQWSIKKKDITLCMKQW